MPHKLRLHSLECNSNAEGPPPSLEFEESIEEVAQREIAALPPDPLAADEERSLAKREELEETKKKQELAEQHDIHLTRLGYVPRLFWLIIGWLIVASILLGLSGFNAWGFDLSEKVLIALITSTTANVLGLFYVVAKWLYPAPLTKRGKDKKGKVAISGNLDLGGHNE